MRNPDSFRTPVVVLGLAAAYFGAARLGLLLQLPGTNASPVWPPSGIALAAALLFGLRAWPGVAVGAFLANLLTLPSTAAGLLAASAIAVGNTLEPVLTFLVLRRWVPALNPFDHPRDLLRFLATTGAACAVASTVGATSLWLTGIVPSSVYTSVWFTWWLGDAAGILVLTPALVCWGRAPRLNMPARRRLELVALVGVTALLAELTFGGWFRVAVPFLVLAGPLWAAFRFGPRETSLLPVLLSVIAVARVWHWVARGVAPDVYVPYVSGSASVNDSLLMLQLFVCEVGVLAVILAAAVAQRNQTEGRLRESESRFRTIFEQAAVGVGLIETRTGRFMRVNGRYCDLIGYTAEEMTRTTFMAVTHPDDLQKDLDQMRRLIAGEIGEFTMEKRLFRKDGSAVWVNLTVSPTWHAGEAPEYHVAVVEDITDRKRSEEKLRESEERHRVLTEALPHMVWTMRPDLTLEFLNRSAAAFTGYSVERANREGWQHLIHADDLPGMLAAVSEPLSRGEPHETEYRFRHHTGEYRWVLSRAVPLKDAAGAIVQWIGSTHDLHDRRTAEDRLRELNAELERRVEDRTAALRESEVRFRAFLDHLPLAAWAADAEGRLVLANRFLGAMLSRKPNELLGLTRYQLLAAADARAHESNDRLVLDSGRELELEETYLRPDGTYGTTLSVKFPVRGADGATVVGGVAMDITARKQAEAALQVSEQRFRGAFDFAPIGLALVSPEGRWLRVNRSLCEIVGYAEGELLATDFQTITHPDDLDADLGHVREVLNGTIQTYQMEKRYFHKRGHVVHILLAVSLVRDANGNPLHFVAQIQDVTERKRAEEQLRESRTLLALALRAAQAGVWHLDIRATRFVPSERALELHGLAPDSTLDHDAALRCVHVDDLERVGEALGRTLADGVPYRVEYRVAGSGREPRWLASFADIQPGPDGPRLVGLVQEITQRKVADEQIRASLREKEVLLKEIHHRVKNNLQIVSALLDLQSGHTTDPQALEMFQESRERVKAMALIHERLYRSQDMARVNFTEYVEQLADDLYRTYKVSGDIRLEVEVDVPPLSIDIAIPCGLLLNELMSNCFKHAFKGVAEGHIRVSLTAASDGTNVLVVSDDGAGFPAGTDFRNTASFGLQLVNTLVEQLDGDISLTTNPGTTLTVRFATAKK